MPLLTIAMADVPADEAGLASGLVNVTQQVSAALGLAVLGTIATSHTKSLLLHGHPLTSSLLSGYHVAFVVGAACLIVGIAFAVALLRTRRPQLRVVDDSASDVEAWAERQAA